MLAVVLVVVIAASQNPYRAMASQTTKQKIDEAQKEISQTEQEIGEQNDKVDGLNDRQRELQGELSDLNDDLQSISDRLAMLEQQIANKEAEIEKTQQKLAAARDKETSQYTAMKKRIQFMYEDSQTLYMEILFKAESFSDFITLNNYIDALANYDQNKFNEYQATRIQIEDLEAKLQSERVELGILKQDAETEKANVQVVINKTSNKVAEYEDLIDEAEQILLEKEQKLQQQQDDLEALKKQYEEELRLAALARQSAWRDISEVNFEEGDRYLLANLIYCEAGGEPYEGKVAVGAVVINRVLSSRYPDTVTGVIYQKSQFSPASSGRLAYALSVNKATNACYQAADEAMAGATNVGTCLYFRTPKPGLTGTQIGNHIFY